MALLPRPRLIAAGVALVLAFGVGWAVQGWRMGATLAKQETAQAKAAQTHTQQALVATETKASALLEHAGQQQENAHDYTQKIAALEAARTADADRINRLQHDIRTTATAHAQAASDAAACVDFANRHQHLGTLTAEGAAVADGLIGLVQQRDAQVDALKAQLLIDRQALEAVSK